MKKASIPITEYKLFSVPLIYKGSSPFNIAFGNVLATKTELSKNKELTDFLIRQLALFFLPVISSRFSSGPVRRRVRRVRARRGARWFRNVRRGQVES